MYNSEYWQLDEEWLLTKFPEASENQIDAFCEKVANILADDIDCPEHEARNIALNMVNNGLIS